MMNKEFAKGSKGMRALAFLNIFVGVAELIVGTGKSVMDPSAHAYCTWFVAGSGILSVLFGLWGLRHLKSRETVEKPETLIVYEDDFVLILGIVSWLFATAMTLLGMKGSLDARPSNALLCAVMCLVYVISYLLIYTYQMRRIELRGNMISCTSFWGREQVFQKSDIKEAKMSLLGTWGVYGRDGKRLFYIEDNMVNAKKFMGKMPAIFPMSIGFYNGKIR